MLAKIHSILAYDVPRTEDVGLPTKFRFNVGPALQPIAGSMPVNRLRHWPNTNITMGLLYTLRFNIPAPETPDDTIYLFLCNAGPPSATLG